MGIAHAVKHIVDAAFLRVFGLPDGPVVLNPRHVPGPTAKCAGCGDALLPQNAWMVDGCPCPAPCGVNDQILGREGGLPKLRPRCAVCGKAYVKARDAVCSDACARELLEAR